MHWRRLREGDLAACLELQPLQIGDEIVGYASAMQIWRRFTQRLAFSTCVVEIPKPNGRSQIIGFGCSIFVSEQFAKSELSVMRPGLNSRLLASISCGEQVLLEDDALCVPRSSVGLDMVILGGNCRVDGVSLEDIRETQRLLPLAFVQGFSGYHLNRILCETLSDREREFNESSGVWRTLKRYPHQRALMIMTREDTLAVSGSMAATLFAYEEPTLGLGKLDKELLAAALRGGTDDDLAERLNLSRSTIKKRWQSLFEQVAETRPDLLPGIAGDSRFRGPQKRHRILTYARVHPSEVRPYDWNGSE